MALVTGMPGHSRTKAALKPLDHPVDALGEGADVVRLDRGEHRDPQLVSAQFAIRLGVDDAVSPQDLRDGPGVDVVDEVDRAHHLRPQPGVGDKWRGVGPLLRPRVQPLRRVRGAFDRPVKPPLPTSQSICSASSASVAMAGVLYVWFFKLFSTAIGRDRKSGTQRPVAAMASIRLRAAGLMMASHRPPSLAKFFCGAK